MACVNYITSMMQSCSDIIIMDIINYLLIMYIGTVINSYIKLVND